MGPMGGTLPCSYGLIHSRNTMSVRVGQFAGLDAVQKVANTLGISENIPHGPAIYIGSFETDLKDLTAAVLGFSKCRSAQAILHHRADRRCKSQTDLSLRAYHGAGARSRRGLDDLAINGRRLDAGNRCQLALTGVQAPGSRKNWDNERL